MIKCHLSKLAGVHKLKVIDISRDTGINRGTITRLYHETAERVDLGVISKHHSHFIWADSSGRFRVIT